MIRSIVVGFFKGIAFASSAAAEESAITGDAVLWSDGDAVFWSDGNLMEFS